MKRSGAAVFVTIVAILAAVAFWRTRAGEEAPDAHMAMAMGAKEKALAPSPSIVLSINARNASPAPRTMARAPIGAASQEFNRAKNLKSLYDRLSPPGAAVSPDDKFVLYKIMASCVHPTDGSSTAFYGAAREARRRELEARIPAGNPDRDKRLALFDALSARCDGFENMKTTRAELQKLLADAAAAGDPRAQAQQALNWPTSGPTRVSLSDDQFRTLQNAAASRDPEAIAIAGTSLSNTFDDAILQFGPDHEPLENRAAFEAWQLVACEYGLDCSADSRFMQSQCAFSGRCAATTVQDHVYYYGVSPYEAQLIDQYRRAFSNAVANNDWSTLTVGRQSNVTSNSHYYFGSGSP